MGRGDALMIALTVGSVMRDITDYIVEPDGNEGLPEYLAKSQLTKDFLEASSYPLCRQIW